MEYIIKPQKGFSLNWKELWEYRELFYFFTWRDIKVKYKQTVLGFLWAVLQPFLTMVVFTVFFGNMLKVPSDGIPYPVFAFSGLLLWNVFASGVTSAGNSMVSNANIIKKIYFPRLIIPLSSLLTALFDFLMAFIVYVGLLLYFRQPVAIVKMLYAFPSAILMTGMTVIGFGSLLAALNVKYRDFRYVIPFFVQTLLFLTPVIYPVSMLKQSWAQYVLALNPMSGAINLFRSAIVGKALDIPLFLISLASALCLFVLGIFYFRKTEYYFADLA